MGCESRDLAAIFHRSFSNYCSHVARCCVGTRTKSLFTTVVLFCFLIRIAVSLFSSSRDHPIYFLNFDSKYNRITLFNIFFIKMVSGLKETSCWKIKNVKACVLVKKKIFFKAHIAMNS